MPDSPFGEPVENEADRGIGQLGKSAVDAVLGYFQARVLLFKIESKEASAAVTRRIALLVFALTLFSLAYMVAVVAGISLLSESLDLRWEYTALWVAGAHAALAFFFLLVARGKFSRPLFENSLKELEKDRQWLQQNRKSQ